MRCGGERHRTGSEAAAAVEQWASVRVVVDNVCGSGEVRSSANVDVDDDRQCSHRYGDKGLGMCCGHESYWTGSEAAAVAEQRGRV